MVERASNPAGRIKVPVPVDTPATSRAAGAASPTPIKKADGGRTPPTAFDTPDAPKTAAEGAYHQRSLNGAGPSAVVGIRLAQPEKAFKSPGAQQFMALLADVNGPQAGRTAAAVMALDSIINYLDTRTDHGNQVGSMHVEIASVPPDERVALLRQGIKTLHQAVSDGILPAHNAKDLNRLAAIGQGMGWNFDFDDNIAYLDTKIIVYDKRTGEERPVSTTEFAEAREKLGQPGEYEHFEARHGEGGQDSYRNFRDAQDPNVFWRDLSAAMKDPDWRGPSWDAFQRAMSSPQTAQWSTIITARGHFPNTIHAALRTMKDQGHIENVPPVENIFPVNLPGLRERLKSDPQFPEGGKIKVMAGYLDRLQHAPIGPASTPVIPPEGGRDRRHMHLWGFSDDDYGTFKKTVEHLGSHVKEGRWPDIKITVFFTGKGHPEAEPHAVVITPDGGTRPRLPAEEREVDKALANVAKLERAQAQV